MTVSMTMVTEHPSIPTNILGTTAGFLGALVGTGSFIWPVIAGRVTDITGNYGSVFVTAAIVAVMAAIPSFVLKETGTRRSAYAE